MTTSFLYHKRLLGVGNAVFTRRLWLHMAIFLRRSLAPPSARCVDSERRRSAVYLPVVLEAAPGQAGLGRVGFEVFKSPSCRIKDILMIHDIHDTGVPHHATTLLYSCPFSIAKEIVFQVMTIDPTYSH